MVEIQTLGPLPKIYSIINSGDGAQQSGFLHALQVILGDAKN